MKKVREILEKEVPALVQTYFDVVLGKGNSACFSSTYMERIVRSFELILPKLDFSISGIAVSSPADVEKALAEGRITIAEMEQLMRALRTKSEAEILPNLEAKIDDIAKEKRR